MVLTLVRVECSDWLREMLAMSMAISFSIVPTIWAPVSAMEAVMLKVPLGFMGILVDAFASEVLLSGKEMGNVVPPMVMESGIMELTELLPPKFIS